MFGRKNNKEKFIEKANKVHNNNYNYKKVIYQNAKTKVAIICPKHGVFYQTPDHHTRGHGCNDCGNKRTAKKNTKSTDAFIEKAKKVHSGKYTYNKTVYKKARDKVTITCPVHGDFIQLASHHLKGHGCNECGINDTANVRRLSKDEFVKRSNAIHNNKYNYKRVIYKNKDRKVNIICPVHGTFDQVAGHHMRGVGCPSCSGSKGENAISNFLLKSNITFKKEHTFSSSFGFETSRLKFDFFLPELDTLIEYDGIQHFEEIEFFGGKKALKSQQKRDRIKDNWVKKSKYNLLRIPYTKFENIEEILTQYLSQFL